MTPNSDGPKKCRIACMAVRGPSGVHSSPDFASTGSCSKINVLQGQPHSKECSLKRYACAIAASVATCSTSILRTKS